MAAVLHDGYLYFVSVGDSAIYHVRGGDIHMVNRPHVFANLLDQAAERGQISPDVFTPHTLVLDPTEMALRPPEICFHVAIFRTLLSFPRNAGHQFHSIKMPFCRN